MKTTKEEIKRVADLAKLQLNDVDFEKLSGQAESVIGYFEKLNELDTSNVDVTSHAIETESVLREDEIVKFDGAEDILKQAPELDETFVQVPKIINND